MPILGDKYTVILKRAHLEWGSLRKHPTRDIIYGEGYLQIPIYVAEKFSIYNSNQLGANIIYNCCSKDGYLKDVKLKASGSRKQGDPYAKQFQGNNNLKLLGDWFKHINASQGDSVQILWTSPTDIEIEKI